MTGSPIPPEGTWPFLVTRGHHVNQRVVMAPAFLLDGREHLALMREVRLSATPHPVSAGALLRNVESTVGGYTIIFREIPAAPEFIGADGDVLLDSSGRPVHLTEGAVLTGPNVSLDAVDFDELHAVVLAAFRWFWLKDDQHAGTLPAPELVPGEPLVFTAPAIPTTPEPFQQGEATRPPSALPAPPAREQVTERPTPGVLSPRSARGTGSTVPQQRARPPRKTRRITRTSLVLLALLAGATAVLVLRSPWDSRPPRPTVPSQTVPSPTSTSSLPTFNGRAPRSPCPYSPPQPPLLPSSAPTSCPLPALPNAPRRP